MLPPSTSPASDDQPDQPAPAKTEGAGSLVRFLLSVALIAWAMRSLVLQPFSIPSGSMLPALFIGDYIATSKWPYGYSRYSFPWSFPPIHGRILAHLPKRGDVVVFHLPSENADLVKRVIGLPGDTVEVRGGVLVLNGRVIPRQPHAPVAVPISSNSPCQVIPSVQPDIVNRNGNAFCMYSAFAETLPGGPSYIVLDQVDGSDGDNFGPRIVPPGRLFLMGDNRDNSSDSRFPTDEGGVGMLPLEDVIGRAEVTFWSTDGSASYLKPWTWFTALRGRRIGNGYTGPGK